MAKKKKLSKLNKVIRNFFEGDGFDEGIERLDEATLVELAQSTGIVPESWDKPSLVRTFRRLWSEGEVEARQSIVAFFKAHNRVYHSRKSKEPSIERSDKIASILETMDATRDEELQLYNAFLDVRTKKITPEKMHSKLAHLRFERKRTALERSLRGRFDYEDRFEFNAALRFDCFGERFTKIHVLKTPIFSYTYLSEEDEATLIREIGAAKDEITKRKQNELDAFLARLAKGHPSLRPEQMLRAFKAAPPDSDPIRPPIDDALLASLLSSQFELRSLEQFEHEIVVELAVSFTPPYRHEPLNYSLTLSLEKASVLETLWSGETLQIETLAQEHKALSESAFLEELSDVVRQCAEHAGALELGEAELYGRVYELLLPQLSDALHITPKTAKRTLYHFAQSVQKALQRRQRQQLLARTIRDFKNLFPLARELRRRLILHIGPTNSGKTYEAMQKLRRADTGYYLAPLRLLALEGYETLKEYGIDASLITGEEQITSDEATHISSTIEMLNFDVDVDVCVIDEVQMLGDRDRGWAWANAIIGAPAPTVIMTGSPNCREAVSALAEYLGEPLEIVEFERKTPLSLMRSATPLAEIRRGTAVVAFSRRDVLRIKQQLSRYYKVSVVYGNLSPEVRREEARRFREKETDILVATDAIAMGLNLPIETILFYTDTKFDGEKQRTLTPSEIHQIAGRAGRFGLSEQGYVGALKPDVLRTLHREFSKPAKPIPLPFNVMANLEHIKLVGSILEEQSLYEILQFFVKNMEFSGPFRAANLEGMLEAAQIVDRYRLELGAKFHLACAPVSLTSPYLAAAFERYVRTLEKGETVFYLPPAELGECATSMDELLEAEDRVKEISLYLWLGYRFSEFFTDAEKARSYRGVLNRYIESSLKQSHFVPRCRVCSKPLPLSSQYQICQSCYRKLYGPKAHEKPPRRSSR